jgi:hypothetical protein
MQCFRTLPHIKLKSALEIVKNVSPKLTEDDIAIVCAQALSRSAQSHL